MKTARMLEPTKGTKEPANPKPHRIWVGRRRLESLQWGAAGPGVLLLHGLTGRASNWGRVASALSPDRRVVALDQRGHGASDRTPGKYRTDRFADDAARAIRKLGLKPAVVIGHSMGALVALSLAARHPALVRGLILEDQSVATGGRGEGREVAGWLRTWPVPFPSERAALQFFEGAGFGPALGPYELSSLKRTPRGLEPQFDLSDIAEIAAEWDTRSYWDELERVRCPVLVVRGERGMYPRDELEQMARRAVTGRFVEIKGATHFVHLDNPEAFLEACDEFLRRLGA